MPKTPWLRREPMLMVRLVLGDGITANEVRWQGSSLAGTGTSKTGTIDPPHPNAMTSEVMDSRFLARKRRSEIRAFSPTGHAGRAWRNLASFRATSRPSKISADTGDTQTKAIRHLHTPRLFKWHGREAQTSRPTQSLSSGTGESPSSTESTQSLPPLAAATSRSQSSTADTALSPASTRTQRISNATRRAGD
jgi:hypothetical protein